MAHSVPVSVQQNKYTYEIPDRFYCAYCFELPRKMFQCKRGHCLCSSCHEIYEVCPSCKDPFDKDKPIRNLFFESELDRLVKVDCAYKLNGCKYHPTRDLVQDHQSKCHFNIEKFGDLVKVCKQVGYGDCDFCFNNGNILDAVNHFVCVHGCILTEGDHLQMELIGFQEAADSDENCFWTPVISDLKEKNYFILTLTNLNRKIGSLSCFSFIMPKLNEIEEIVKIEYSLINKNYDSLEWRIFQNARHFSKVEAHWANDAPCAFSLQKLKFHILENGSLLLNIRVHEIVAKNSSHAVKKKVNRIVCKKKIISPEAFPLVCDYVHGFTHLEARARTVSKNPNEIIVEKLPDSVTKKCIKVIFGKFGKIRSIQMFGANTCLIDFVDKVSVRKVVEKKMRLFLTTDFNKSNNNVNC